MLDAPDSLLDTLLLANIDIFSLGLKDLLMLYPFSIGLATLFKLADVVNLDNTYWASRYYGGKHIVK